MTRNIVQVTQQDIDGGDPGQPDTCPIALAMSAWHQYEWTIETDWATAADGRGPRWEMDPDVSTWLLQFEYGYSMRPIALVMDTKLLTIRLLSCEECGSNSPFTPTPEMWLCNVCEFYEYESEQAARDW